MTFTILIILIVSDVANLCEDHEIDDESSDDDSSRRMYTNKDDQYLKLELDAIRDLPLEESELADQSMIRKEM